MISQSKEFAKHVIYSLKHWFKWYFLLLKVYNYTLKLISILEINSTLLSYKSGHFLIFKNNNKVISIKLYNIKANFIVKRLRKSI